MERFYTDFFGGIGLMDNGNLPFVIVVEEIFVDNAEVGISLKLTGVIDSPDGKFVVLFICPFLLLNCPVKLTFVFPTTLV